MPYGKPYKRTGRRVYRKRRAGYRKPPAAVRKKTTVKSTVRANWYKNQKLTRKVDYLLKAKWGTIQTGCHAWHRTQTLTSDTGLLFDVTDFTCARATSAVPPLTVQHARIFQLSGGTPNVVLPQTYWTNGFYQQDLFTTFENRDLCGDTGYYMPLYGEYELFIECRSGNADRPPRVQLDLLCHTKKGFTPIPGVTTAQTARTLPWAVQNFSNPAAGIDNINGVYFKRLSRKTMVLNNNTATATATMTRQYRHKFSIKPKRPIYQMQTFPQVPGTEEPENTVTSYGNYGPFNRDPRSTVYMFITTDSNGPAITVNCVRKVKWRDPQGSSGI